MSLIVIKRSGKLYRFVEFLSNVPFYSLFIRHDYQTGGYVTFRDVCTFCRHVMYFLLTTFLLIFLSVLTLFLFFVYPFIGMGIPLENNAPLMMFLIFIASSSFLYLLALSLQKASEWLDGRPPKEENKEEKVVKEPSAIHSVLKIISKKHRDFCHRLKIDN